jgi:cell pole-organizing protein PopZ
MASNPQHEPTMEEILASIRKIISEDSSDGAPQDAKTNGAATDHADSDVFELREADIVEEPASAPAPVAVAPAPEPARVMQVPLPPKPENDIVFETREETPVNAPVSPAASNDTTADTHEGFFSDTTRKAMHETFAKLDPVVAPAASSAPASTSALAEGASVQAVFEHAVREKFGPVATDYLHGHVDDIVERMKPLIREWMDEHFPAILEGAVRNEVERAVKAAAAAKPRR